MLTKKKASTQMFEEIGIHPLILPHEKIRLEPVICPDRKEIPNPFYPKIKKLKLIKMITKEALVTGFGFLKKEERRVILSRPCIYGVFGGPLGGLMPRREYCTGCMRCVLEYPEICTVERNPDFLRLGDSYWIPKSVNIAYSSPLYVVNYEARTGKIPIKGMGYKGLFAGDKWDSMWTDMSEIVRPTRDGVHGREYISTIVDLGRKPELSGEITKDISDKRFRVVKIPIPIIFDQFSNLANEKTLLSSIYEASNRIPLLFIEEPGFFVSLKKSCNNRLWVPLIRNKAELEVLERMDYEPLMIEVLNDELFIQVIRERYPNSALFVRIEEEGSINDELLIRMILKGADGFHLIADYHGEIRLDGEKMFIKEGINKLHNLLVENSMRERVSIIAGGGITMAEHVPKAIIMGADAVSIDTSIGVALQLAFKGEVKKRGASGFAHEKIDVSWGSNRLLNLICSWHGQLIEILSAMGMRDVRRLRGDIGRAMFNEELEKEAFGDLEWH